MRRRIVITGMGVITPLGNSVEELFSALSAGRSGVGPITHFDAGAFPTRIAAEVKNFDLGRYVKGPERWAESGPNTRFALAAAKQALEGSRLLDPRQADRTRFGVYLGSGEGEQDFHVVIALVAGSYRAGDNTVDSTAFIKPALKRYRPTKEYEQELHTTPAHVAEYFALDGPNYNCLTSCAAGAQALGEALEIIRRGEAEVMLAGGSHSMIHPLGVTGFCRLTALSTSNDEPEKASRPFDARRNGFVLGEGAGILILEELEHARRRQAPIVAELTGYGVTADAYRVTDSHPEGRGAVTCMNLALADAELTPADIGYINAHGTSTELNDKVESLAVKKVFGPRAPDVPISSTKSMLGHLIGAAGPVEAIIAVETIRRGLIPPTINYENPDFPDCDLDYVPNQARAARVRHVLSNSFGFGGQNVALVISEFVDK